MEEPASLIQHALLENANDYIAVIDTAGMLTFVNEAGARLLGYDSAAELIGQHVGVILSEDGLQRLMEEYIPAVVAQGRWRGVVHRQRKNGDLLVADQTIFPVHAADGGIAGYATIITDITQQWQTEQALRASEARYRQIVETAQEGVWVIDADSRTTYVNTKMAEMLGYTVAEMIGQPLFAFMDEEGQRIAARNVERRRQGIAEDHEFLFQGKDGRSIWTLLSTNPLADADGGYAGALAMVLDISARKQAEQALAEQEATFRAMFEQSSVGMAHVALDGRWLRVNQRMVDFLGYAPEELMALAVEDVSHPDDGMLDWALADKLVAGEMESYSIRKRYFRKTGAVVWGGLTVSLVRDEVGTPVYFVSFIHDISGQVAAEQAALALETTFRATFEQAAVGMAHVAVDGHLLLVNQQLADFLGYTRAELVGMGFQVLMLPDDLDVSVGWMNKLLAGEVPSYTLRKRYVRKTGAVVWGNLTVNLVRTASGEVDYFMAVVQDISALVAADEAIAASEKRYRRVVEEQTELICRYDADFKVTFANRAYAEVWGETPEGVVGMSILEKIPEAQREHAIAHVRALTLENRVATSIHETVLPSGEVRVVEWTDRAIFDKAGELIEYQGVGRDVTEREQMVAALAESEAKFATVFEAAPVAIGMWEIGGALVGVNRAFEVLTGYTRAEAIGQTVVALELWAADQQRAMQRFIAEGGQPDGFATTLRRKDGAIRRVLLFGQAVTIGSAKLGLALVQDVTDQWESQQALAESEAKFATVFEAAPVAIAISEVSGPFVAVNAAFERISGSSRAEAVGKTVVELGIWTQDQQDAMWRLLASGEQPDGLETMMRRKDGVLRRIALYGQNLPIDGVNYSLALAQDVTEQWQAQQALVDSEAKLAQVVAGSPLAIQMVDRQGRFLMMNPAAERLTGYAQDEALGKTMVDLGLWTVEQRRELLQRVQNNEDVSGMTATIVTRAGDRRDLLLHARRMRVGEEEVVLSLAQDVTEPLAAKAALEESEARFAQVFEATPVSIGISDEQGRFEAVNAAFEALTGYGRDEALGKTVLELGLMTEVQRARLIEVVESGHPLWGYETVLHRKDGAVRRVAVFGETLWSDGRRLGIALTQDITARWEAEQKLAASEARFVQVFESAPLSIGILDEAGRFVAVNAAFEALTGYGREVVIGKNNIELGLWSTEAQAEAEQALAQMGAMDGYELVIQRGDGQQRRVALYTQMLLAGGETNLLTLARDITAQWEAEEALAESEARYGAIFEQAQDAIMLSRDGVIVAGNPKFYGLFRMSEADVVGKPVAVLFPPMQPDGRVSADLSAQLRRETAEMGRTRNTWAYLRGDGTTFEADVSLSRIEVNGQTHFLAIIQDLTVMQVLLHDLQREAAVNSMVGRVSVALRKAETVEAMLPVLLDEVLAVLELTTGSVVLYDSEMHSPTTHVQRGWLTKNALAIPPERQGILWLVYMTGERYQSSDVFRDAIVPEDRRTSVPPGCGVAAVPVKSASQTLGVLLVAVQQPRVFGDAELDLLETIAAIAGNAVQRTLLHQRTLWQLRRLQTLRTIDIAIQRSLDLEVTLGLIAEEGQHQLQADCLGLWLVDDEGGYLQLAELRGQVDRGAVPDRIAIGDGLLGRVSQTLGTVLVFDGVVEGAGADEPVHDDQLLLSVHCKAWAATPLMVRGKAKGVLAAGGRDFVRPDRDWVQFLETLAGQAAIAIDESHLVRDLQRRNRELRDAYETTLEGWSAALDLRDKETEGHTQRVTSMMVRLARAMGVPAEALVHIRRGALLHDIGKMGIPDQILLKPGPLTDEEWVIMKKHPQYAYDMLAPIAYLHPALAIPYCHHEKWDGSGYPQGLKGEAIPLAARIFAIVDVWDALRSDRPYRSAWSRERVLALIEAERGKHFDPAVVEEFFMLAAKEGW